MENIPTDSGFERAERLRQHWSGDGHASRVAMYRLLLSPGTPGTPTPNELWRRGMTFTWLSQSSRCGYARPWANLPAWVAYSRRSMKMESTIGCHALFMISCTIDLFSEQ